MFVVTTRVHISHYYRKILHNEEFIVLTWFYFKFIREISQNITDILIESNFNKLFKNEMRLSENFHELQIHSRSKGFMRLLHKIYLIFQRNVIYMRYV